MTFFEVVRSRGRQADAMRLSFEDRQLADIFQFAIFFKGGIEGP
ncbi:MAG: hypothetical protein QXH80_04310 [Candidatus Nanoarchaeia archaeon]